MMSSCASEALSRVYWGPTAGFSQPESIPVRRAAAHSAFSSFVEENRATPNDAGLLCHGVSWVDFCGTTTAHYRHSASISKHLQVLTEIHIGQHLNDHIRSLSIGSLHDPVDVVFLSVVEDLVSSIPHHQSLPLWSSCRSQYLHPKGSGDLARCNPHPSTGPMNKNGLSCFALGLFGRERGMQ
uniref:Uncharacterized protein n=1 Tax=Anguilla anguilla TaxID=7936 RepID=A0A0E9WUY5_ANGAN